LNENSSKENVPLRSVMEMKKSGELFNKTGPKVFFIYIVIVNFSPFFCSNSFLLTLNKMPSTYTQAEVEKHNVKGDLWMTIHEKVYDVSTFAEDVSSTFL
jgi:cytochrome b involved in lipid metabolism